MKSRRIGLIIVALICGVICSGMNVNADDEQAYIKEIRVDGNGYVNLVIKNAIYDYYDDYEGNLAQTLEIYRCESLDGEYQCIGTIPFL